MSNNPRHLAYLFQSSFAQPSGQEPGLALVKTQDSRHIFASSEETGIKASTMATPNPIVFFDLSLGGEYFELHYFLARPCIHHCMRVLDFAPGPHAYILPCLESESLLTICSSCRRTPGESEGEKQLHIIFVSKKINTALEIADGTLCRRHSKDGRKLSSILHRGEQECSRQASGLQRLQIPSSGETLSAREMLYPKKERHD